MLKLPGVNSRIREIIDSFCQGKEALMAEKIAISQPRINRLFNLDKRNNKYPLPTYEILSAILKIFKDVSADWLVMGRGKMLQTPVSGVQVVAESPGEYGPGFSFPLYRLSDFKSLSDLLYENRDRVRAERVSIPGAPSCDGALLLSGTAGGFGFTAGDIILYRALRTNAENIFYGERYLLSFETDGHDRLYVGYIYGSDDENLVKLSVTPGLKQSQPVALDRIRALALVVGTIRFNHLY